MSNPKPAAKVEAKATPVPWKVNTGDGYPTIDAVNECWHIARVGNFKLDPEENKANAALIVRAVNTFDARKAILLEAAESLDDAWFEAGNHGGHPLAKRIRASLAGEEA